MKKSQIIAIAALALAATFQTAVKAEDPINPVQGAVCNLYWFKVQQSEKGFAETAASLPRAPASATFVDTAADFKPNKKKDDIASQWGMWTGWLKQENSGTFTFTCSRGWNGSSDRYLYLIWINGQQCFPIGEGQTAFDVELNAGFNSVKIIAESDNSYGSHPLSITYKKKGSVKDPKSFGPGDMWYDDEE